MANTVGLMYLLCVSCWILIFLRIEQLDHHSHDDLLQSYYTSQLPISPESQFAPVGLVTQNPTSWNSDGVLSGSQSEWAQEDAAQHALNLANWRIKILQAKLRQAKLSAQVMNVPFGVEQTLDPRKERHGKTQIMSSQLAVAEIPASNNKQPKNQALRLTRFGSVDQTTSANKKPNAGTWKGRQKFVGKLVALKMQTDKELDHLLDEITRGNSFRQK